jgi:hypothetical protein
MSRVNGGILVMPIDDQRCALHLNGVDQRNRIDEAYGFREGDNLYSDGICTAFDQPSA